MPSFIDKKEWHTEVRNKYGSLIRYEPTELTPPHIVKEMKQWNKDWQEYNKEIGGIIE